MSPRSDPITYLRRTRDFVRDLAAETKPDKKPKTEMQERTAKAWQWLKALSEDDYVQVPQMMLESADSTKELREIQTEAKKVIDLTTRILDSGQTAEAEDDISVLQRIRQTAEHCLGEARGLVRLNEVLNKAPNLKRMTPAESLAEVEQAIQESLANGKSHIANSRLDVDKAIDTLLMIQLSTPDRENDVQRLRQYRNLRAMQHLAKKLALPPLQNRGWEENAKAVAGQLQNTLLQWVKSDKRSSGWLGFGVSRKKLYAALEAERGSPLFALENLPSKEQFDALCQLCKLAQAEEKSAWFPNQPWKQLASEQFRTLKNSKHTASQVVQQARLQWPKACINESPQQLLRKVLRVADRAGYNLSADETNDVWVATGALIQQLNEHLDKTWPSALSAEEKILIRTFRSVINEGDQPLDDQLSRILQLAALLDTNKLAAELQLAQEFPENVPKLPSDVVQQIVASRATALGAVLNDLSEEGSLVYKSTSSAEICGAARSCLDSIRSSEYTLELNETRTLVSRTINQLRALIIEDPPQFLDSYFGDVRHLTREHPFFHEVIDEIFTIDPSKIQPWNPEIGLWGEAITLHLDENFLRQGPDTEVGTLEEGHFVPYHQHSGKARKTNIETEAERNERKRTCTPILEGILKKVNQELGVPAQQLSKIASLLVQAWTETGVPSLGRRTVNPGPLDEELGITLGPSDDDSISETGKERTYVSYFTFDPATSKLRVSAEWPYQVRVSRVEGRRLHSFDVPPGGHRCRYAVMELDLSKVEKMENPLDCISEIVTIEGDGADNAREARERTQKIARKAGYDFPDEIVQIATEQNDD